MTYVLDASSLLRYTDNEAGADRILDLLTRAARGETSVMLSAVNWGEITTVLYKRYGPGRAEAIAQNIFSLPITIVPVSISDAESAGFFKFQFNVPYADAFAGSLAMREKATLITADFDFKNVPRNSAKIEFLPSK